MMSFHDFCWKSEGTFCLQESLFPCKNWKNVDLANKNDPKRAPRFRYDDSKGLMTINFLKPRQELALSEFLVLKSMRQFQIESSFHERYVQTRTNEVDKNPN